MLTNKTHELSTQKKIDLAGYDMPLAYIKDKSGLKIELSFNLWCKGYSCSLRKIIS